MLVGSKIASAPARGPSPSPSWTLKTPDLCPNWRQRQGAIALDLSLLQISRGYGEASQTPSWGRVVLKSRSWLCPTYPASMPKWTLGMQGSSLTLHHHGRKRPIHGAPVLPAPIREDDSLTRISRRVNVLPRRHSRFVVHWLQVWTPCALIKQFEFGQCTDAR
ncbi:hypothetical protein CC2G_015313 [Coprinopsis cinerea AmutBmut pab1-1]|nr:hypothetical protein CC2G_015313 [Coprinopsis cinerea AmutBmut pab1-1]